LPYLSSKGLDVHYAIVGVGEDYQYLTELAREQGVADRVHLLGHVEPEELPRWINAADLIAMPNRAIDGDNEGFGMVFLEAAACGKPVVAGCEGGTGAAVLDGKTGLRVDGTSTSAVCNAIARLLHDSALANQMGAAGLRRVQAEFAWDRIVEQTRLASSFPRRSSAERTRSC
jgi:phosphatidylinositol alpha-1,6-mannosyltransferase